MRDVGVYNHMTDGLAATLCLLVAMAAQQSSTLPWIFPSDIRARLHMSDLVVSGTILESAAVGLETVDGIEVNSNLARMRIDRVFKGANERQVQFKWFVVHIPAGTGYIYSGPPLASFHPQHRYLVFLTRDDSRWVVAMPVYAIEVKLASESPTGALRDLSQAPLQRRYQELAEELERAALLVPPPPTGVTGDAATYFPAVFDLLGGCAEPFYRRFMSSPSFELRRAALNWLNLIESRAMTCHQGQMPTVP
jgi:hypothetical protein